MSDVLRVLREARELISDESRWTRKHLARDGDGTPVCTLDSSAVCYCALGAVSKVSNSNDDPSTYPRAVKEDVLEALRLAALAQIQPDVGKHAVPMLNDRLGHAAVLAMFDAAIATEQAKTEAASS